MSKVIFNYKGKEETIECSKDEKMKDICQRFSLKSEIDINKIYFIYNGNRINEEIYYIQLINEEDRNKNIMNILVYDENIYQSNEIICPECKESILFKIKDYKISLNKCKNGHSLNNILLNEYEKTQNINLSKIICDICKINNKNNNEIFICFNCKINLCPDCKIKHDKEHKIINYNEKNYICDKHYEKYTKYCSECKLNICIECEKEHKSHKGIYYGEIFPDNNNNNELRKYIDKLKYEIKDIIKKLENIIDSMEIYYKISDRNINNKIKNYENLTNLNELINYNNIIIKDIKEIIDDYNINNKFKNLMNLYESINSNNEIVAEIKVKEDDVNKDIRIINSYEQYRRENNYNEYDKKYENEKDIKESCRIKINNEIIPFSYFYKFKRKL